MIQVSRNDTFEDHLKEDHNLTSIPLALLKQGQNLPSLSPPESLRPLSTLSPMPSCRIITPVIARGAQRRQHSVLPLAKIRWKKQLVKDVESDDEDDNPLSDFTKPSLVQTQQVSQNVSVLPSFPYHLHEHLSQPFPSPHPCTPAPSPPVSIGYKVFIERYERLKNIGLVDGSGQWLDTVVEDPVYF